jgi:hypothetical protein
MQMVKPVLERDLERHFSKECKRLKLTSIKLHLRFSTGYPDRLVVLPFNKVLWIELKTLTGKLSARQEQVHFQLRLHHHCVLVLRTKEEITNALETASIST